MMFLKIQRYFPSIGEVYDYEKWAKNILYILFMCATLVLKLIGKVQFCRHMLKRKVKKEAANQPDQAPNNY